MLPMYLIFCRQNRQKDYSLEDEFSQEKMSLLLFPAKLRCQTLTFHVLKKPLFRTKPNAIARSKATELVNRIS